MRRSAKELLERLEAAEVGTVRSVANRMMLPGVYIEVAKYDMPAAVAAFAATRNRVEEAHGMLDEMGSEEVSA